MLGTKVLEIKKSKFNGEVKVIRSFGLGTYIQVGGLTQSGGIVESIWKSTLKEIKNRDVNSVLILGLGGGTLAKLSQKIWPHSEITGVDIDPVIVDMGRKHLGLNNVEIKIEDASKFVQKNKSKKYDLILVDMYQGSDYPEKFEEIDFIKSVKNLSNKNGVIIFNRLYSGDKRPVAVRFGLKLQNIFKKTDYFYPEANLMFINFVS